MKKIGGDIRSFFSKISESARQPAINSPSSSVSVEGVPDLSDSTSGQSGVCTSLNIEIEGKLVKEIYELILEKNTNLIV